MRTALLVLLSTCLMAVSVHPASAEVTIKPYEFEANSGERVDAELGEFAVLENRSDPKSRTITLKFVRFKCTSGNPGSPIVYLAGGPGGSGIGTARGSRFELFMAMREFGDVIALDQRGTGMSGFDELDCDDRYMIPFDRPMEFASAAAAVSEATKGCVDHLRDSGIDVSAYNTKESASDLEDLRIALGADKLTPWGISYGTHLALAAMKYHGDSIDRVILAGLEALHHTWKLPGDQQALMEEIARLAAQDPAVREAVPDLLGSIARLLNQLEREPQTVVLTDPRSGGPIPVTVGKFDLQFALSNALRGPSLFAVMPDAISRLEHGDWTALALASSYRRTGEGLHGMSVAMDCASGATREWLERIEREADGTLLGNAINCPFPNVCDGLGINDLGDEFREPVVSGIPALLISGSLDGRTPVRNGEEVAEFLSNAQHLIIEGAGHSDPLFLSSPEILAAMKAFMRGEKIDNERIVLPPVRFIAPRRVVTLTDDVLDRYVGKYRINDDEIRVVMRAGNLLYTRRGRGPVLPIRPTSETSFFYEGYPMRLTFETDADGEVVGMTLYQDESSEGEKASRFD